MGFIQTIISLLFVFSGGVLLCGYVVGTRPRKIGLFLGGATFLISGWIGTSSGSWAPLIVGLILAVVLKKLGFDPGWRGAHKATLLWVDDEPEILAFVRNHVTERGYAVTVSSNSQDALKRLKRHPYDLLVTDLRGIEREWGNFINEVKGIQPSLAIIIYSGKQRANEVAKELGCFASLSKPSTINQLVSTFEKALDMQGTKA